MTRSVFLTRHGHTAWNEAGRYLGKSDIDLDDLGRAQADRLGAWAAATGIDALLTSPALRAARTASAVAARLGIQPRLDDRLLELDFGAAEGRTLAELRAGDPDAVARFEADPFAHPLPGGEDPAAAVARVRAALADLLLAAFDRPLVVTHNTLLRLLLCDVLDIPRAEYRRRLPVAEHCAVTELSFADGIFALRRFNAAAPVAAPEPGREETR